MGSVMMGTMAQQINQGIAKHKQNVERSRGMLENMLPIPESDLTNMWNIAQLLADSDPTAEQTWRIELAIFRAIGKAHWRQWDMKTNAKGRVDLGSFFQDATARGQVWWARYILRLYGTMGHKVKAVYHDSVTGETLSPLYFYIKGTYPSLALATTGSEQINGTDKTYRMRLQDILFNFRLVQNTSLTVAARYHSPQYIAEVFTAAGLTASENDCMALMNAIGFKWTWKRGVKFSGRGIAQDTLGIDLHSVHNVDMGNGVNKQGLIIALIACFTSFHGHIGWTWLNHVLIQGAWPWLGGYNKSYAKTVFTAMVCMFCCVRHGYVWSGAGPVVLRLAGKLVDPECFGTGRLRLRGTGSLGGEKVLYEPVPKTNETEEGEAPAVSEGAEKVSSRHFHSRVALLYTPHCGPYHSISPCALRSLCRLTSSRCARMPRVWQVPKILRHQSGPRQLQSRNPPPSLCLHVVTSLGVRRAIMELSCASLVVSPW